MPALQAQMLEFYPTVCSFKRKDLEGSREWDRCPPQTQGSLLTLCLENIARKPPLQGKR